MNCPNCKYDEKKGKKGKFFELSNLVRMERQEGIGIKKECRLLGCPNCKKAFIEI